MYETHVTALPFLPPSTMPVGGTSLARADLLAALVVLEAPELRERAPAVTLKRSKESG